MGQSSHTLPILRKTPQMLPVLTAEQAFDLYESVRNRYPVLPAPKGNAFEPRYINNLGEVQNCFDAFVFDAFGVLNVGVTPIKGACERIEFLRDAGKKVFVLTNAASYCFDQVVEKFDRLGFSFMDNELVSSRAVCEKSLACLSNNITWGVAGPSTFSPDELDLTSRLLHDDLDVYDDVDAFLFLSTEDWSLERHALMVASLLKRKRPVIVANPDIVAPREQDMSVEPGFYAHNLLDKVPGLSLTFHGKTVCLCLR